MKKTTYAMIGLALGALLLLLGIITYIFTCTGYVVNRDIIIDGPLSTTILPPFKKVRIVNGSNVRYTVEGVIDVIIEQNDTLSTASLSRNEGWNEMLQTKISGDTLILSVNINDTIDPRVWPVLRVSDPIRIKVPKGVGEFQNRASNFHLKLSGFNEASVCVSSISNVDIENCDVRSYINYADYDWCEPRYPQKIYLNLHRATIESFVSFEDIREFGLGMDSVSSVNNFTWISAARPGEDEINLKDCKVKSFAWIKNDSLRVLSLKADAGMVANMN